jgi:hypothetical protein
MSGQWPGEDISHGSWIAQNCVDEDGAFSSEMYEAAYNDLIEAHSDDQEQVEEADMNQEEEAGGDEYYEDDRESMYGEEDD